MNLVGGVRNVDLNHKMEGMCEWQSGRVVTLVLFINRGGNIGPNLSAFVALNDLVVEVVIHVYQCCNIHAI